MFCFDFRETNLLDENCASCEGWFICQWLVWDISPRWSALGPTLPTHPAGRIQHCISLSRPPRSHQPNYTRRTCLEAHHPISKPPIQSIDCLTPRLPHQIPLHRPQTSRGLIRTHSAINDKESCGPPSGDLGEPTEPEITAIYILWFTSLSSLGFHLFILLRLHTECARRYATKISCLSCLATALIFRLPLKREAPTKMQS